MLSAKWMKAIRDLWINKTRSILGILAMAIGGFGCGFIINAYTILIREMDRNYRDTNPASFTIYAEPLDSELSNRIKRHPGIQEVEPRRQAIGRVRAGNEWRTIFLYVIEDFNHLKIDQFSTEEGSYPPARGEILLERAALTVAASSIGDDLIVKLPEKKAKALKLAGTVHAPGLPPAWMENRVYGFISEDTYNDLGGTMGFNELRILVQKDRYNERHISNVAKEVQQMCALLGYSSLKMEIPKPGKHPHADQMSSLLFLLQSFGFLALILSGVLVANMFSSMLAKELRQIGIMKTLGGRSFQLMGIYYGAVTSLGLLALIISIPAAIGASRIYAVLAAMMLNFEIGSFDIPWWTYLIQILIGLAVPLAAASYPIWRSGRITVREALDSQGIKELYREGIMDRFIGRMQGVGRPLILSVRNTFRRKGRVALTLITLAVGGAFFIVALNVGASIEKTVANSFKALRYDTEVKLTRPYAKEQIRDAAGSVTGIAGTEIWGSVNASLLQPNGSGDSSLRLIAPPSNTQFLRLPMMAGRWLKLGNRGVIVLNHTLAEKIPGISVGDMLTLDIGGLRFRWRVIGVAREIGAFPKAYMSMEVFEKLALEGKTHNLMIRWERQEVPEVTGHAAILAHLHGQSSSSNPVTSSIDPEKTSERLMNRLSQVGIDVTESWNTSLLRQIYQDHLQIIVSFLMIMALLIVGVGGLGLASTMSMNILERMREFGVMRALGGSDKDIRRIILGEGVFIGVISWVLSVLLSIPLTFWVANTFGQIFFHTSLDVDMTHQGLALWLMMVAVITALSGCFTARSAIRGPVRDVLVYE